VHSPDTYGDFDYKNFITGYLGIPLYLGMIFGYKFWFKTVGVRPETADLFTGKDVIDREEAEFLARKAEKTGRYSGANWFYRKFVGWLF
jgi:yeast amino acid transporter